MAPPACAARRGVFGRTTPKTGWPWSRRRAAARPPERATTPRLQRMLIQQLRALGVRMLIIDELQRLSKLGPYEQAIIMDALRYISNQLHISIAGFGSNEAKGLIEGDLHLKERFEVVALPGWTRKDRWPLEVVFQRLAYMPLRKPTDVNRELMEMLERHSGRNLGRLLSLLERSAVAAVDKEECLSADLVEAVAVRRRRAEVG
ncbi:TniB family NTP-binding protein [Phenylobacterium sp.]|uniref:TniB family NTP-binding protein n=1 Tax=Phenylobacterium sp. TaxID=1871053 RepID=UPI0025E7ACB3|nr:TniB family NTP-binding protein [Phenylobacterium sp.]